MRLICATCRDLPALVRAGSFRQDLFFRIQGACLRPPPLRMRADRVRLAEQLLAGFEHPKTLTRAAAEHVAQHDWPGNIRELKSALTHASALSSGHLIDVDHFPEPLLSMHLPPPSTLGATSTASAVESPRVRPRSLVLKDAVDEAVRASNGNLSEAARQLRMARSTLYRILRTSGK